MKRWVQAPVEKTFDRRGTARAGSASMRRNADRCEDRSRGPRAVAAPQERDDSSRVRLERNRAESIEWQQKNRLLGGGPAHTLPTRAYHTEYTPAPRLEHAYVTTGFDVGATAQSSRPLVTCPEGGGQPQSVHSHNRSPPRVARPSAMGMPTVGLHGRSPAAKDRVTKSSGGRVCTSARKVGALRALVKTAIAAGAGTEEPSQPKVSHSTPPSAAAP